jgi:hypothetical protein
MLTHVVWVDDVLRQWCDIDMPMRPMGDGVAKTVHQANAIRIMVDRGLVLIDPIADVDGVKDSIEVETLRFIGAPNAYERAAGELDEVDVDGLLGGSCGDLLDGEGARASQQVLGVELVGFGDDRAADVHQYQSPPLTASRRASVGR